MLWMYHSHNSGWPNGEGLEGGAGATAARAGGRRRAPEQQPVHGAPVAPQYVPGARVCSPDPQSPWPPAAAPTPPLSFLFCFLFPDEVEDPYAGLVGGIVVGRKGELKEEDLSAKDVDRWVAAVNLNGQRGGAACMATSKQAPSGTSP